jgi:hypothetical protein
MASIHTLQASARGRRALFIGASCAWACFRVLGAPIAHADKSAQLSVSAIVVTSCEINTRPLDAALALSSSLRLDCGPNASRAQIGRGARRSYSSPTFAGDVMVTTINF